MRMGGNDYKIVIDPDSKTGDPFIFEGRTSKPKQLDDLEKGLKKYAGKPTVHVQFGSFQALGNPGSFHARTPRKLRLGCYEKARDMFSAGQAFQGYNMEMNPDRVGYRRAGTKIPADKDKWHRDICPARIIEPEDHVYGGWINLDSTPQRFICKVGTHNVDGGHGAAGFAKEASPKKANAIIIPPGHMVVFYQWILHAVAPTAFKTDSFRLFTSFRVTKSDAAMWNHFKPSIMLQYGVPKTPSGQVISMTTANHRSGLLWKITIPWTVVTLKPEYICTKKTKCGPSAPEPAIYFLPHSPMEPLGPGHYPPYMKKELDILVPQKIQTIPTLKLNPKLKPVKLVKLVKFVKPKPTPKLKIKLKPILKPKPVDNGIK